ncbi:RNA polymerase sigma factor [Cupriavidus basilensis]
MDLSAPPAFEATDAIEDRPGGMPGEHPRTFALRAFLVANYKHLRRRLARHLGCPDLATECLHDAWLRLGDMAIGADVQSPDAYVYRVACNAATDRLRSNRASLYAGDADAELDHIADLGPGPDLIAEARSALQAVERAFERMPYRHRVVLLALRLEELPRQEVATRHGLSLRRVDTMLRQALEHCAGGRINSCWRAQACPAARWRKHGYGLDAHGI